MALDLTGIQNENEFYTSYYLREVLEKDLKDEFADWAEQSTSGDAEEDRRSPHEALGGQAATTSGKATSCWTRAIQTTASNCSASS